MLSGLLLGTDPDSAFDPCGGERRVCRPWASSRERDAPRGRRIWNLHWNHDASSIGSELRNRLNRSIRRVPELKQPRRPEHPSESPWFPQRRMIGHEVDLAVAETSEVLKLALFVRHGHAPRRHRAKREIHVAKRVSARNERVDPCRVGLISRRELHLVSQSSYQLP